MRISGRIRSLWREVEDILTAATGPILIAASALAAADIFSNHVFSERYQWIPAAWAVARALAVTIWLGVAWEFYLKAREKGESGGWWLLLALGLFAVDLQTALLFAVQDEGVASVGTIPLVTIPAADWVLEQAILGVVLIAVHRAVDHQTHAGEQLTIAHTVTVPALVRPNTQPDDDVSAGARRIARRAYWDGPYAPLTGEEGVRMELVTDEREERREEQLTRQTSKGKAQGARTGDGRRKPRRRDAGRETPAKEQRIVKLMAQLRVDPAMTIEEVADFLDVSRGTAVTDRAEAKRRLRDEHV